MRKTLRKNASRNSAATYASLLQAAETEFNMRGFDGTDSNRIARAAGFAPQTFYRHFEDKRAAFLAVYERWWKGEVAAFETAGGGEMPSEEAAVRVALAFHTKWRGFRRALRHLAIVDPRVRAARTAARRSQMARITSLTRQVSRSDGELAAALLKTERLCDAMAEGELADLGISQTSAKALVRAAIKELLGSPS